MSRAYNLIKKLSESEKYVLIVKDESGKILSEIVSSNIRSLKMQANDINSKKTFFKGVGYIQTRFAEVVPYVES
jgi:hypothetical protein